MNPSELATTRRRLGLTLEGLAAELNLTPAVVAAWESGRIRPSRRAAQWLLWRSAMLDRDEALAASGLPECAELRALHSSSGGVSEPAVARRQRMDAILAHLQQCPTCITRRQFIDQRFPRMPQPPMAPLLRLVVWVFDTAGRIRRRLGRGARARPAD